MSRWTTGRSGTCPTEPAAARSLLQRVPLQPCSSLDSLCVGGQQVTSIYGGIRRVTDSAYVTTAVDIQARHGARIEQPGGAVCGFQWRSGGRGGASALHYDIFVGDDPLFGGQLVPNPRLANGGSQDPNWLTIDGEPTGTKVVTIRLIRTPTR